MAGRITCYAQGFAMLAQASKDYGWNLPMPAIAEVWREGCIIRPALLNDIATALANDSEDNLMFAPYFANIMKRTYGKLREFVSIATLRGHPVPALSAAVAYFDTMRTSRGTANMLQAHRNFFGAHSFKRRGEDGSQHDPWGN